MSFSSSDELLLEAVTRFVALIETSRAIRVIAPLVLRETAYRILIGEQRPRLRQITSEGVQAERIALAIDWLGRNFDRPFRALAPASRAHISPSAFHRAPLPVNSANALSTFAALGRRRGSFCNIWRIRASRAAGIFGFRSDGRSAGCDWRARKVPIGESAGKGCWPVTNS
jgi:hypothetical protein